MAASLHAAFLLARVKGKARGPDSVANYASSPNNLNEWPLP